MSQTTLSERAVSEAAISLHSDPEIADMTTRVVRAARPTATDVTYSPSEWERIIEDCTASLALAVRERVNSPARRRMLSAIAMKKSGERSLVSDAVNLTISPNVSDTLSEKVTFLLYHGFKRLPIVSGALLAGWIQEIKLLGDAEYRNIVAADHARSTGYYDPDDHWIAIRRDSAWAEPDAWPLSKPGTQFEYDLSTTLHELGHALHYMLGVHTVGHESVDNRGATPGNWTCAIQGDVTRAEWQWTTVIRPLQAAYANLERGNTDPLDFKEAQASTLEEFIAEGYAVWATSPNYLKQAQPRLWAVFNALH